MDGTVQIEGDELVIRLPISNDPPLSGTGKSFIIATTGGFTWSDVEFNGKRVSLSAIACIKKE